MGSVSRFITVMSLVLSLGQPTLAEDWGTKSGREEALEELKDFDPSVRRSALARLAETGISEDVPYMLRLLRDDNFAVRGMADQAITGLWLRLDNLSAKRLFVKAIGALQSGESNQAIEYLDAVIEAEPSFSEAWNKRG